MFRKLPNHEYLLSGSKDLEDQVSVTNSIFGTDLSVNTDEEYIIHCDDLSKIFLDKPYADNITL